MQKVNYEKDTFEEYLGKKDHISASDIKNFIKSPKFYHHSKYLKQSKDEAKHFAIGSAMHEMILEPHQFRQNYMVVPKVDRRTKDGKEKWEQFIVLAQGKTILTEEEMEIVVRGGEQSAKNDTLVELIKDSYRELSCYTIDEKTGLKIKVRPDILCKNKSTIVDIKSCLDSSYNRFKYDNINSYQYDISAAFYCDFLNRENYVFCAIEKSQPYQASLYVLSDEYMERGRKKYRTALDLLKWSYDNDYWCDYFEYSLLVECYELDNLDKFFEIKQSSEKIRVIN